MRRATVSIAVFYLMFSAALTLLSTVGFFEAIGYVGAVPAGDSFQAAVASVDQISAAGGNVDSLIALFTAAAQTVKGLGQAVLAAPQMLIALGVPTAFVAFVHAPLALLVSIDVVYTLTGREL